MHQEAFRRFYDKAMPPLRAFAIRHCGSVDLADDLVQEAFLRFLRSAPGSLTEPQMRAYLYRTVENLMVNHWHGRQREHVVQSAAAQEPAAISPPDSIADVERALSQLDGKQRTMLWLAYVEGFDHKEIAAVANVHEKSVRVLLFRARQALKDLLKGGSRDPEVL